MVIAFADIYSYETSSSDNTKMTAFVKYVIFGGDIGDLDGPENNITIYGVSSTLLNDLKNQIADAVKDDMVAHGISVGLLDTVFVW